jgi:hypothetical protein
MLDDNLDTFLDLGQHRVDIASEFGFCNADGRHHLDYSVYRRSPIEILSPEDRPLRVSNKVRQLLDFGAPNIWVIDPETFEAEIHTPAGNGKMDDGILRVTGSPIEVPLRGLEE